MTTVDTHAHIFATGLPLAPGHRHAPQYDATLTQYLAVLDAHATTYGVLTAPSFFGTDNSHLLSGLSAARGRLRGTVIVEPTVSIELLQRYAEDGVVGIRLNFFRRADRDCPDLASAPYRALFERCVAYDWHVEIYGEGPRLARWLPPILSTGVKVVVDHFGSPDETLGAACPGFRFILSAFDTDRLWVKLSAPYRVGGAERARVYANELLGAGGSRRLVWGSDWPWTQHEEGRSYRQCLAWLEEWVPNPAQRNEILGDTALSLFHFPAASSALQ
ncbi:MAG TPA: amidohydrolase family protein [Burkholderiales bacterium]|nr:amidohydrolase family protein [Burkholderiales bacterium]